MAYSGKVEYAKDRKLRERNTVRYRMAHWPIWIWVFFLAPGPLIFSLFAHGFSRWNGLWLALVLVGTGIAGSRGNLPGAERGPIFCGSMRIGRTRSTGGSATRSHGARRSRLRR